MGRWNAGQKRFLICAQAHRWKTWSQWLLSFKAALALLEQAVPDLYLRKSQMEPMRSHFGTHAVAMGHKCRRGWPLPKGTQDLQVVGGQMFGCLAQVYCQCRVTAAQRSASGVAKTFSPGLGAWGLLFAGRPVRPLKIWFSSLEGLSSNHCFHGTFVSFRGGGVHH